MWLYKDSPLLEVPETAYGYVYLITNTITGRKYIGKKLFWFRKTKQVKGKKKRIKVESDWRDYWSSSEEVKKDVETLGVDNFIREILYICPNKGSCNYLEAREQMDRRVLETEDYYNGQVQCRVHKTHIKNIKEI
jgi:Putative endonuclease segE, GIY-YIG domain